MLYMPFVYRFKKRGPKWIRPFRVPRCTRGGRRGELSGQALTGNPVRVPVGPPIRDPHRSHLLVAQMGLWRFTMGVL